MAGLPDKRTQVLAAAIELFATKGFRGTSVRDIANAISSTLSSIYHFFGNKEGVILAILEHFGREIVTELTRISELDLDPLERFELLIATHIQMVGSRRKENKVFLLDEEHLSPEGQAVDLDMQRRILEAYRKTLGAMKEANLVRCTDLTVTAFNILGVVNWLLRWYRPGGPLSLEQISQEMMSFILTGILGSNSKHQTGA
jgi:TetR/AcrR family transcriptional regulator, cholesterol catabolism regulator